MTRKRFHGEDLTAIDAGKIVRIRAGIKPHRFLGIWVVVVEHRVFVRSWNLKARSWYRTFLTEPRGALQVGDREIAIRALPTRSERLKSAVDQAYLSKYNTRASLKFARGLGSTKRRNSTMELLPL